MKLFNIGNLRFNAILNTCFSETLPRIYITIDRPPCTYVCEIIKV